MVLPLFGQLFTENRVGLHFLRVPFSSRRVYAIRVDVFSCGRKDRAKRRNLLVSVVHKRRLLGSE